MAHKAQLENKKYRNWVRAGLGIKYVKEGLEPFCDHLVKQQHYAILDKVKRKHNLSTVSCGICDVHLLQSDHVLTKTKQCPLGQTHCNCLHLRGKLACPNKVCGAIYDEIIQLHASTPPVPNWRNTDAKQWCTEPWAIAKCFINAPGYEQKNTAAEFDCTGLLHVLLNNIEFQKHIKCVITGADVFSRVRKTRNDIFHSDNMQLEDAEVYSYIDDMIKLLEDDKEIKHRHESKDAVKKLKELKQEHFIISTKDDAEIRRVALAAINEKETEFEQTITNAGNKLKTTADKEKHDIQVKCLAFKSEIGQEGQKIRNALVIKKAEIEQTWQKIRQDFVMKETELEQTGQKISQNLISKEAELERTAADKIEQKVKESTQRLKRHLMEETKASSAKYRKNNVTSKERKDFKKKLIKLYGSDVKKVAPMPRLYQNKRNVDDMYVPSWMTEDLKNEESGRWEEVKISMDKIFKNNEEPAKCIYVIGEAGSGKSTFCKMLVHFWCIAHSEQEGSSNEPDIVHEMKRFDFLFYFSLRYYSDCDCIEKMLEKSFHNPALRDILQNDSSKCLIVLDGLDEWNLERKYISQFQTSGRPGHEPDADYTIITTSRQWKFDVLSLSDSEVGKKIKLNGIDKNEMRKLTVKTVETLNGIQRKNKNAEKCIFDLGRRKVSDISHIPLMLQQLVCLWFNDKLQGNSKCAIYGSMLDLFLEWKSLETSEIQDQLYVVQTLSRNTRVKQYLSCLAYETLFDRNKESTLTFSSFKLIQLNIPQDVIQDCLASGILKEERNVSLSENMQSTIFFFHKSVQEYLAAEYIASQFKEMLSPKDEHALRDVGKICVDKYFGSCKTVVDVLDRSNVLIMLCGLEPRLLTNVSEYIYNVSLVDKIVVKERNEITKQLRFSTNPKLIIDIQTNIFNCIEEVLASTRFESVHSHVYIADLYVSHSRNLLRYCHKSILKNVLSVEIVTKRDNEDNEAFHIVVKHLTKCDQLKVINFRYDHSDNRINNEVTTILETNVNTLETVSLIHINEVVTSRLVPKLPEMRQLTSIQVIMESGSIPHNVMLSLNNFLNQATRLQHISLNIYCEKYDTHKIDLSKHKQVQHVDLTHSSFCTVSCNTDNLETCELELINVDMMNQVCNILCKADKLKQLSLYDGSVLLNNETEFRNITENIIRLLPSLVSLGALKLSGFTFTDNIIACPCDMNNLKELTLFDVTMNMTMWCKFIDCLSALPQVVKVIIHFMDITDKLLGFNIRDAKQDADARQYVREKTNLFRVTYDRSYNFQFTTKKA